MGLFSSSKEVYVNSSVYNLAGDGDSRPDPIKQKILSHTLSGSSTSLARVLRDSMLSGPGIKQRRFFTWAKDNYHFGMPTGSIGPDFDLNTADLYDAFISVVPLDPGEDLEVISGTIDTAQVQYWVEAWLQKNQPDYVDTPRGISVERNTDPLDTSQLLAGEQIVSNIVITFSDTEFTFPVPADLEWGQTNPERRLLYMLYNTITVNPETKIATVSGPYLFTYRMGSGVAALDAMAPTQQSMSEFYPAIPLRIWNKSARDFSADGWNGVQTAYKKLVGSDVSELLDQVEDNPDIRKIDYCLLVQGVSLNTSVQMGQRYLFEFFRNLQYNQNHPQANYDQYDAAVVEATRKTALGNQWKAANTVNTVNTVNQKNTYHNPSFGTSYLASLMSGITNFYPYPSATSLIIRMPDLGAFNYNIGWDRIIETDHVGNAKHFDGNQSRTKAKVGDYWVMQGSPGRARRTFQEIIVGTESERQTVWRTVDVPRTFMFHQYAKRRYTKVEIWELQHWNRVYKYYSVRTEAGPALASEDESRFMVPLHQPTVKAMGLSNAAQLASTSSYLVFNTVEIVKIKWYQKKFFKVVLIFAAVATAAFTGGLSFAGGAGILGTNVAVGTAIGATAAAAALVGAAVNYIAATIVTAIIQAAAEEFIGGAAGAIIGTIASFVAIQYGAQFAATGNFNVDWGSLMRMDNLMKLTDSVSGAYTKWMEGETEGIIQEMGEMSDEFDEQTQKIKEMSEEILGMTDSDFDPMMFTDAAEYFGESSEVFLNRTLLTGSDLAQLTYSMIENFVPVSLELPRAISK